MSKILIAVIVIVLGLSFYIIKPTFAGGDKVHGDKAAGDPTQTCLNFDGCPYGDLD